MRFEAVPYRDDIAIEPVAPPTAAFRAGLSGGSTASAGLTMSRLDNVVTRSVASAMAILLPVSAQLPTPEFLELTALGPSNGPEREHWVDLAAQGMRVRGQLPPPAAAAHLA